MRKLTLICFAMVVVLFFTGNAIAGLTKIGTATWGAGNYGLIYDDSSIDGGLVWLDYASLNTWEAQKSWAASLGSGSQWQVSLYEGYTTNIDWTSWRLPKTEQGQLFPDYAQTYNGSAGRGFNITTSEMGHLFYVAMGNTGAYDTTGMGINFPKSLSPFQRQGGYTYWSETHTGYSTEYKDYVYSFSFMSGEQNMTDSPSGRRALAVHEGFVRGNGLPVPVPGAVWLLGLGLIALVGIGRRKLK